MNQNRKTSPGTLLSFLPGLKKTLTDQEAEQFRQQLRPYAQDLLETLEEAPGPKPTLEELIDYNRNRLSPQQEERVRTHLVRDPELTQLLLLHQALDEPFPSEKANQRRRFVQLAAAFLLPTVLLGLWINHLYSQVDRRQVAQVQGNMEYLDLRSGAASLRNGRQLEEPQEIVLEEDEDGLFIAFNLEDKAGDYDAYTVEVWRQGRKIDRFEKELRSKDESLRYSIPRALLASGDYELHLLGLEGGHPNLIAIHPFRIRIV